MGRNLIGCSSHSNLPVLPRARGGRWVLDVYLDAVSLGDAPLVLAALVDHTGHYRRPQVVSNGRILLSLRHHATHTLLRMTRIIDHPP